MAGCCRRCHLLLLRTLFGTVPFMEGIRMTVNSFINNTRRHSHPWGGQSTPTLNVNKGKIDRC